MTFPLSETYEFRRHKFIARGAIPNQIRQSMRYSSAVALEMDALIMNLTAYVAADPEQPPHEIRYPTTWKDGLLAAVVPKRLQRGWLRPSFTSHWIYTNYVYPNLELPERDEYLRVCVVDVRKTLSGDDE